MKNILVCGAGGFIASHLVTRLKNVPAQDNYVIGVDIKQPEYINDADEFHILDLTNQYAVDDFFMRNHFDEVYQLAADMGGADYIFTGNNDLNVMTQSMQINLNVIDAVRSYNISKIFYSSSACVYSEDKQLDKNNIDCREASAYPANPDSNYGWEKLFSERLYMNLHKHTNTEVRIARFHNTYGPCSTYDGGKEKAPAALCRKVALCPDGGSIDVYGSGEQVRSFIYITDCLDCVEDLMLSGYSAPVNIGSDFTISINDLAKKIIAISGKSITINNIDVPQTGVVARTSDNELFDRMVGTPRKVGLPDGLKKLYQWVNAKVNV
jgi:nucleoside-diphosphate-sugar epimerase|tara:strand:+ start:213 stop:1184 length:972 start_codon:yes stop_codon:yes gene_type:complete